MSVTKESQADERLLFGAPRAAISESVVNTPDSVRGRCFRLLSGTQHLSALLRGVSHAFEAEREHGALFLFVPVFMALGAIIYFTLGTEPQFLPLALSGMVVGGFALLVQAHPATRAILMAAAITTGGMLAAKFETWRADTPMLGSEITTVITGRVVRIENQATGRVRLTIDVIATERPTLRYSPHRVRATARAVPPGLGPGEIVRGVVRLMPASGPVRPDSYDFAFESYFDGIGGVGFFYRNPERSDVTPAPGFAVLARAAVEKWRLGIAERISQQIGGAEGAIAAALVTGVRAGIPEEINEALRIVGLYHVISISGLHMALVGGTVMVSLRAGFALAPTFASRRAVKKYAAAALCATAFYLFASGADVAAQRSFIMLGVMLMAVLFDRAALTMRNLAISAIIILLISPHEVMGPSFQMSFAATAALVAAYEAWTNLRSGRARARRPLGAAVYVAAKYAAGLSATSIVAGAATALFTAWHFQQVSPMGLLANLAAMPFVSIIVMPMAVLASLLMPLGLEAPPLYLMGVGIAAMNVIAFWLADRSAFDATGAIPFSAVLMLAAALAILTMSGTRLRLAAVPLLIAGFLALAGRELPDVLVAEDGRLVAVRLGSGNIAVNVPRPRAFVLQNWQRALNAADVVPPRLGDPLSTAEGFGFVCNDRICLARTGDHVVVHAKDTQAAEQLCARATLIVIDNATAGSPCAGRARVVTKRDLARAGSAEILLPGRDGTVPGADHALAAARFSIREPFRPWHEHRRFSRAARGLAPYQSPAVGN